MRIREFLEIDHRSKTSVKCKILAILKYKITRKFPIEHSAEDEFALDLLLVEHPIPYSKFKMALLPRLNGLIYSGYIRENSVLEISRDSLEEYRNDAIIPAQSYFVLKKLELQNDEEEFEMDVESLGNFDYGDIPHETNDDILIPLTAIRSFYSPVFGDNEPLEYSLFLIPNLFQRFNFCSFDPRWNIEMPVFAHEVNPSAPDIHTILSTSQSTSVLPIIGRITGKSSILSFSSTNDHKMAFPLTFSFDLRDSSAEIKVTVWNNCVLRYFNQIHVGDIVALTGYRIKTSKLGTKEIAINPSSPKGDIFHIKLNNLPDWNVDLYRNRFPHPQFDYSVQKHYAKLPDDEIICICGRIQYISQILHTPSTSGIFRYRIARIVHQAGSVEFIAKIFSCSQSDVFESLDIGDILRTTVKINSFTLDSVSPRLVFVTTTLESQLTVWTEEVLEKKKRGSRDLTVIPTLKDLQIYARDLWFDLPVICDSFQQYSQISEDSELISFADTSQISTALILHEKKRICIQAKISSSYSMQQDGKWFRPHNDSLVSITSPICRSFVELKSIDTRIAHTLKAQFVPNAIFIDYAESWNYSRWEEDSLMYVLPPLEWEPKMNIEDWINDNLDETFVFLLDIYRENFYLTHYRIIKIFRINE